MKILTWDYQQLDLETDLEKYQLAHQKHAPDKGGYFFRLLIGGPCKLHGYWLGIIYLQNACPKVCVYCIDGMIYRISGITDDVGKLIIL